MVHEEIAQAREDLNLTREQLAKMAGMKRGQIRRLETGENWTRDTLLKVLPHLPNLKSLTLGGVKLHVSGPESAEIRDAVAEFLETGRRVLTLLERAAIFPDATLGSGARTSAMPEISADLEERLRKLESQVSTVRAADKRQV